MNMMMKGKKKYWKLGFILGLAAILVNLTVYVNRKALVSYVGMKLVDAQQIEAEPDKLTLADFSEIPGVTQEYVDAYKIFLEAKSGGKAKPTYADAVAAFDQIAASTTNPEIKLRSLYVVTLVNFLQFKIDQAYKSGQEVLTLSKQLYPQDNSVLKLEKVTTAITKGEIKDIKGLKTELAEVSSQDFAEDLNATVEGQKDYQKLKEKLETKKAAQE